MPEAIIFDMDGVLSDSEPLICKSAIAMLAEKGIAARPEDFIPYVGTGEDSYLGNVARLHGHDLDLTRDKARCYEIFIDLAPRELAPIAGAVDFVRACRQRGLALALATSADRVKVDASLPAIGLAEADFDAIVTADLVAHKKPAPDIFLQAARLLGKEPGRCLVVEDAPAGLQAAHAAGCRCLALTTTFPADRLAGADWMAPDLSAVPAEALDW